MANDKLLNLYHLEYDKLKEEQTARIGFRDNLLYVTLGLFGGILSFTLQHQNYIGFLIIPWVCFILGWTYLVNDQKISAIGHYMRNTLSKNLQKELDCELEVVFGWETGHRDDKHRIRRKRLQLIVDELTFVASGLIALLAFWLLMPNPNWLLYILCIIELFLLVILAVEIIIYADLKKGR